MLDQNQLIDSLQKMIGNPAYPQIVPGDLTIRWIDGATDYERLQLYTGDGANLLVKPPEADFEAFWAQVAVEQGNIETVQSARHGLKEKIALAHDPEIAGAIKDLYNAALEQVRVNTDLATTYGAYLTIVNAAPQAFQTRYRTYILNRTNIDVAILPHTDAQRRQIVAMSDVFVGALLVPLLMQES